MTLDEEFEALVDSIPGFAGWYVADDGTPTVQLVDTSRLSTAQMRLASRIENVRRTTRPDGRQVGSVLRAQHATYDFRQLRAWSLIAERLLDVEPAAVYVDVDEITNRVEIGVADLLTAARVGQALLNRGVPTTASRIAVVDRPKLTADSITRHVRPVPGGIIINPSSCTLGFNANFGGTRAFITASHCTGGFGNLNTPRLFFNFNFAGEELGWEIYDPSPWQSTSDCILYLIWNPTGICRYSDAAIADYQYLPADSVDFGYIARTTFRGPGVGIVGSRLIDPSNRHHEITEKYYSIPTGIYLDRLGVTSGWTFHNVSTACYTQYLQPEPDGNPYYHAKLWCQYKTGGGTSGGDSGGPYWAYVWCTPSEQVREDGTDCIRLAGVHWGREDSSGRSLFSPISGIETDLGTLGVRVSDNP